MRPLLTQPQTIPAHQRGAALIVFMLIFFLASMSLLLSSANSPGSRVQANQTSSDALALAKAALLARAAATLTRPGSAGIATLAAVGGIVREVGAGGAAEHQRSTVGAGACHARALGAGLPTLATMHQVGREIDTLPRTLGERRETRDAAQRRGRHDAVAPQELAHAIPRARRSGGHDFALQVAQHVGG